MPYCQLKYCITPMKNRYIPKGIYSMSVVLAGEFLLYGFIISLAVSPENSYNRGTGILHSICLKMTTIFVIRE